MTMMTFRWLAISLLILLLCIGILWLGALSKSQAREIAGQMQAKEMKAPVDEGKEYVLEIIGFGVTLDKYRQAHSRPGITTQPGRTDGWPCRWCRHERNGLAFVFHCFLEVA